jgi:hypothetical protein
VAPRSATVTASERANFIDGRMLSPSVAEVSVDRHCAKPLITSLPAPARHRANAWLSDLLGVTAVPTDP